MSGFNGINQFGSLTTSSGVRLTFEQLDKDKDGTVTKKEYNEVLKELELDTVSFSSVDTDKSKDISQDEFALWEQKVLMQDAVNNMAANITADFAGKPELLKKMTNELKDYIEEFAETHKDSVETMAKDFTIELPKKYAEIKTSLFANDPSTVKSAVLDDIFNGLMAAETGKTIDETTAKRIATELEKEADRFIKNYKGTNLEEDLKAHLNEYMNQSDKAKLETEAADYRTKAAKFTGLIDSNELKELKEIAKEFLLAAVNKGVTIVLGGTNIKTSAAVTSALAKFTDGDTLKAAMEDAINGLSTQTLKEKLIEEEKVKAQEAAEKAFTDIKGSEYQINPALINYSNIPGYFDNKKVEKKGKGKNGAKSTALELINNNLKEQFKQQVTQMLQEKGIPFDKIATIFENVFNTSATEAVDACVSGKFGNLFHKSKSWFNTKDLVDKFVATFNTNIAKAMDEMNASKTDFDTVDLDLGVVGKDANGNPVIDPKTGEDLSKLYASGRTITVKKHGADYFVKAAVQMIDNLKQQMLTKAKAMCDANGVEFDSNVFSTMFDNAKSIAINTGVSGVNKEGKSVKAFLHGTGTGVLTTAAIGTGAAIAGGVSLGLTTVTGAIAEIGLAAGPVGWAIGGAAILTGGLASIFGWGKNSEKCSLNVRTLIDTFTEQFKTNYTSWVESEKAKDKTV